MNNTKINNTIDSIKRIAHTRRGHNALVYGIFLIIATIFWFMMSLNDEVQRDYRIPVNITDLPTDITLLSSDMPVINTSVKDRGRNLIKYDWGHDPELNVRFSDFSITDDNRMILSTQTIKTLVRDLFSSNTQIAYLNPDSIVVKFTSQPGVRLPVFAAIDIQASPQHIIHGPIKVIPDSVSLFAPQGIPSDITALNTARIAARGISDTITYELNLDIPAGMRVKPDKVKVIVPVEPLISKTLSIKLNDTNVPAGQSLLTFPSKVDVSFLLPMSEYSQIGANQISATIDYRDIDSHGSTLPVHIGGYPDYLKSVSCSPNQVEYIVETDFRSIDD